MANAIITKTYQDHSIAYQEDGWFNATQAAAKFGKRVDHWLGTKETQEYIAALCEDSNTRKDGYLKTKRGNNGGTWLHLSERFFSIFWHRSLSRKRNN